MLQSQYFVVNWIYFALVSAVLLRVARVAVGRLKQPTDRIRVIQLSLLGVTVIPLLLMVSPWALYRLPIVNASSKSHQMEPRVGRTSNQVDRLEEVGSSGVEYGSDVPDTSRVGVPLTLSGSGLAQLPTSGRDVANVASEFTTGNQVEVESRSVWDLFANLILVAFSTATICYLVECCIGAFWMAKILSSASAASQETQSMWERVTNRRARHVRVLVSEMLDAPLMFGTLRPVVLLPAKMVSADSATLRFCLSHEWCHIERNDMLSWQAVRACQCLLWFLPSYWSLRTELRLQQDLLADDRSTRGKEDAVEYSEVLLGFAQKQSPLSMTAALTLSDRPTQLSKRINMLLENPTVVRFQSPWQFNVSAVAVATVAALFVGSIRLDALSADDAAKNETAQAQAESKDAASNSANDNKEKSEDKPAESKSDSDNVTLKYQCKVVDKTNGQGIPNARVTVRRSVYNSEGNKIIEESKHVTDADGNYEVIIPPEQVAVSHLYIELDVEHDDYSAKKGFGYALSMIRKNEKMGERPFFEKTEIYPGEAVTGTIISPEGKPVEGVKVQSYSMVNPRDFESGSFNDCLTDAKGRFRIVMHKNGDGVLWVIPKEFASMERFLAKQRGDLGTIKLTNGVRVSGKVTNAEGKPLAGLAVNMDFSGERDVGGMPVATSVQRGAISDAEGRFEFDPLPPGDYVVMPSEHLGDPLKRSRTIYEIPGVFVRDKVTIKEGVKSQSIAVQAVPHVVLHGQIYDSKGQKRGGHEFHVFGQLDENWWFSTGRPDKEGTFATRIPHGLQKVRAQIICNEHQSLRYRMSKDQAPQNKNIDGVDLGTMNDDVTGFEIIYYKAPVVLVSAVDEEQKPVPGFKVVAAYPWGDQRYILAGELRSDLSFEHQADGRYRTSQMLPDEDVTFTLTAPGYETTSKKIKVPEGETQELVVTMKKGEGEKPKAETEND